MRIAATTQHADWKPVRQQRDRLLEMTDRLMIPDFPITAEERAEATLYRAALRDLLSAFDNPASVVWPLAPPVVLAHLPLNGGTTAPGL